MAKFIKLSRSLDAESEEAAFDGCMMAAVYARELADKQQKIAWLKVAEMLIITAQKIKKLTEAGGMSRTETMGLIDKIQRHEIAKSEMVH